jgi:hypothetical protein
MGSTTRNYTEKDWQVAGFDTASPKLEAGDDAVFLNSEGFEPRAW